MDSATQMPWPADQVLRRPVAELVPYARNARLHSPQQVQELVRSISEYGWTIPVLTDEAGTIIAGHGRVMAAEKLGLQQVPVMVARGWTEAQKQAYRLADNQLALHATWDLALLKVELTELRTEGFDLGLAGFSDTDVSLLFDTGSEPYTQAVNTPVYQPKGDKPKPAELVQRDKAAELLQAIDSAKGISKAEKEFLRLAAARHNVFDYHLIAEFYCHASPQMQALMEASALVIIDFDQAISRGFVQMSERLDGIYTAAYPDEQEQHSDGDTQ